MQFLFEQLLWSICLFIGQCFAYSLVFSINEINNSLKSGTDIHSATNSYLSKIAFFAFITTLGIIAYRFPKEQWNYCSRKGIKAFKDGNYHQALYWFIKASETCPDDAKNLFNIACIYSHLRDSNNCLAYLQRSLLNGYSYKKVKVDPDLIWLRSQINIDEYFANEAI